MFVALVILASMGATAVCWGLPQSGMVQEGNASWEQGVGSLIVNQTSDRALLDWNSFDIGNGETVKFVQPGAGSIAINRVVGDSLAPSQIDGNLFANGNVWILNPNGVLLGGNAKFDVGGLAVGAALLGDDDMWDVRGDVENRGEILAGAGGVVLGGKSVANHGNITTKQGGNVTLAAGRKMQVGLLNGLVMLEADPADVPLRVENTGAIVAPGGQVGLMMQAVDAGVGGVMNVGGRIVANTVGERGGVIRLGYAPNVKVSADLRAEGDDAGERGGRIEVAGKQVDVAENTRISADGRAGGGAVLVGGDLRGQGHVATADVVNIGRGAEISARATEQGNGGKVVVWADDTARFAGHVAADGAGNGDGGTMEVSGKSKLVFRGTGSALGGLEGGNKGVLLLDPQDIVIADGSGGADDSEVVDGIVGGAEAGTTFTISEQALEALSAGTDVILEATRNLTLQDLADNALTLAATGNVRLVADSDFDGVGTFSMNGGDSLVTAANVAIRGANLSLGSINTSSGNGSLALTTTNSAGNVVLAGTLNTGNGGLTLAGNLQKVAGLDLTNVGAINLTGNSTLTGGNITMDAANVVTGARILTVNGNAVTLAGMTGLTGLTVNAVNGANFLGNISTNGAVAVTAGGGITGANTAWTVATNGSNLTLNSPLTLAAATTLNSAGGIVTLDDVDGAHDLNVTVGSGRAVLGGSIGGGTPVANMTVTGNVDVDNVVNASGHVLMTGGTVNLRNNISAGDDLTLGGTLNLGADSVLTGGGSNGDVITLSNNIVGAHNLTLAAGSGQAVLNGVDVGTLALTSGNGVTLNGGSYLTDTAQNWSNMGGLTLGGNVAMVAGNGPGYAALTFGSGNVVAGAGHDLSLRGSSVAVDDMAGVRTLAVQGSSIAVNGDIATTGTQTYTGPVVLAGNLTSTDDTIGMTGAVTLVGNRTIDTGSGAGDITLGGTVDGASALTLLAGTGDVTISGNVGGVTPLTSLNITAFESFVQGMRTTGGIDVVGDLTVAGLLDAGTFIRLRDDVLANVGAAMTAGTNLTVDGRIALAADLALTSGGGAGHVLTIGNGVIGDHLLTLTAGAGDVNLTGNIDIDALTLVSGDDLIYGGGSILTDNAMTFTSLNRVLLSGDTLIEAGEGGVRADITFGSANQILATTTDVDLTVTGDRVTLYAVGDTGSGALESLTVNAGTAVLLGDIYTTGDQTINATQGLAGLLFSAGGDITLNTAATLVGDVSVQSHGGNVYFQNILNGGYNLTVDAAGGDIYLNAMLGLHSPLSTVTMTGHDVYLTHGIHTLGNQVFNADHIFLNAGLYTYAGEFVYNAPLVLTGDSVLETHGGDIRFGGTVDGPYDLTVRAGTGDIMTEEAVGGTTRLGAVTVDGAANVNWKKGLVAESYTQNDVAGLTDLRGIGLQLDGDVNIATSGKILGHIGGRVVAVEARDGWIGTVAATDKLVLSTNSTELEGTVLGMSGRSAALRTEFGRLYGQHHYLNGYGLPLHELSVATPATSGGILPWQSAFGMQAPGYLGMPVDGLWGSQMNWPDTWDTVGTELWGYGEIEPAAGKKG